MNENVLDEENGEERDRDPPRADREAERLARPRVRMPGSGSVRAAGEERAGSRAGADHDRVAERVEAERDAGAEGRDDEAAEGGADDPRRRAEARAERDRVR